MTEEHKRKIQEGRKRAKLAKLNGEVPEKLNKNIGFTNVVNGKPVLPYTGKEETGFDFWPELRKLYRPVKSWEGKRIEREIVDSKIWKNIEIIKSILSKYVHLELVEGGNKKIKKARKKRKELTPEQKLKLAENLKKAREARKKKEI